MILLTQGISGLLLLTLKVVLPFKVKDLTVASISQAIHCQGLILHLFPNRSLSKKIRFALAGFDFLLKASFLAWLVANPEEGWGFELSTRSVFKDWTLETSLCVLVIGPLALLLNIGQIVFQDEYVAKVISRFPDQGPAKENDSVRYGDVGDHHDPHLLLLPQEEKNLRPGPKGGPDHHGPQHDPNCTSSAGPHERAEPGVLPERDAEPDQEHDRDPAGKLQTPATELGPRLNQDAASGNGVRQTPTTEFQLS